MQISALIVTVMASFAIAVPTGDGGGGGGGGSTPYDACREVLINAQPQCCAATVGDIADLTCATVSELPSSPEDFRDICAETGKTARCCTVSLLGISLLCGTPVGL